MTFTCPKCGKTSYNPHDEVYGYCGSCKEFITGPIREQLSILETVTKVYRKYFPKEGDPDAR